VIGSTTAAPWLPREWAKFLSQFNANTNAAQLWRKGPNDLGR
jgi:hypothetical protein